MSTFILMNNQQHKARDFAALHIKGEPVILFNIWDAGSAKVVAEAGAKAIATGSHSVAAANGFDDGELLPLDIAIANIERIVKAVEVPVTLDFEGGYAADVSTLKTNVKRVLDAGAVGINFEDQVVGGDGLYSIEDQARRIAAIRETANEAGVALFVNARTDLFLKNLPANDTQELVDEAVVRAEAYEAAGASGLFAPGLRESVLIKDLCDRSPLPVNIFVISGVPPNNELAALGVARISYGPGPYRQMIASLKSAASAVYA